MDIKCLVCFSEFSDGCPRCGISRFIYENVICNSISPQRTSAVCSELKNDIVKHIHRVKLSHYFYKMFHNIDINKEYTQEYYDRLKNIILEALSPVSREYDGKINLKMDNDTIFDLPNPMQQLDRLMLFLGDNNYTLGNYLDLKNEILKDTKNEMLKETKQEFYRANAVYDQNYIDEKLKRMAGYIGINQIEENKSKKIIYYLFEEAESRKWVILTEVSKTTQKISLTIDGYQYYQSLLKNISHSSFGFLAMKFPPMKIYSI